MKCFSAPANLNSCFTITKGKFHNLHFRITPSNYRDQVPEEWRAIQKKWKKFDEISFDWFCLTEPIVWEKIRKIRIKNDLFFFYWEHSHIVQVRSVCRPDLPQLRAVLPAVHGHPEWEHFTVTFRILRWQAISGNIWQSKKWFKCYLV